MLLLSEDVLPSPAQSAQKKEPAAERPSAALQLTAWDRHPENAGAQL